MAKSYMDQTFFDRQADRIERALTTMSLPAKVQGGQVTDRWIRYHLEPSPGTQVSQVVEAAEAVADALGADELRVAEFGSGLAIDVAHNRRSDLRLLPLMHSVRDVPPMNAVVGMQTSAKPLILDLNKRGTWHLLTFGPEGCGKSELLRTLLVSLVLTSRRSQLNVLGVDIGGRELGLIEALPHALTDLATDEEFATDIILWLAQEVQRRLENGVCQPHLLLVVDDFDWIKRAGESSILSTVNEILLKGFDSGVHIIAGSRNAMLLPMLSARRRGGLVTANAPVSDNGSSTVRPGRFQIKAGNETRVVDAAYLSARDLDTAVKLANSGWRVERMSRGLGSERRS